MYWYGAVVVRGLATTSDKSPAVKFYCPVPHKEYLLCIFHSCAFYRMQDIHFSCLVLDSLLYFVVVALSKKTCLSLKNLLVLVVLEHGVSVEGKVVEVVLNEEL